MITTHNQPACIVITFAPACLLLGNVSKVNNEFLLRIGSVLTKEKVFYVRIQVRTGF